MNGIPADEDARHAEVGDFDVAVGEMKIMTSVQAGPPLVAPPQSPPTSLFLGPDASVVGLDVEGQFWIHRTERTLERQWM